MLCAAPFCGKAQELNARITVNGDKIATANKQIFTTLQNSLTEFVNNRKWTDATFAVNEKIDCTMTIIVNELDETNFKSEIQIQARRPVYNSSYTTTLLNFRDQQLDFEYTEGERFGTGVGCNGRSDRADAVGGRNACRDAFRRLYRHGECRTVAARIDGGHRGQVELPDPLFGQTEAYDATASADHQGHLFDGHICRGKDQIAFVLSVFIVNQQDSAALAEAFCGSFDPFGSRAVTG